jgi:AcrR family transcriptional regulator
VPRIVDVETRRQDLAEAVWRVIRRDGVEQASVRTVAAEAGLSVGSLRHYFASQSELLAFAMRLVIDRATARVAALPLTGNARANAETVLQEVVPLDAERRAEVTVWLAFTGQALVDPILRSLRDHGDELLLGGCRTMIAAMIDQGSAAAELDLEVEAERLHALIDGLSLHAVARPEQVTRATVQRVLRRHLDALAG